MRSNLVRKWEDFNLNEFQEESGKLYELSRKYLDALLTLDRQSASKMIHDAVEDGVSIKDIYIHVFEASQHEVGRLWQNNLINVAQEHYCSACTQQIMGELYPYIFHQKPKLGKILATCVAGEMHEIGIRIIADLFQMEGWDSYYLGANTPTESILETISDLKPDLVAISASIHYNLPAVISLIEKIRKHIKRDQLKIMVGGRPFQISPELWKKVGADFQALNAVEAIKIANKIIL